MLIHPTVERLRASAWPPWPTRSSRCRTPVGRRRSDPRGLARPAGRPRSDRARQQAPRPPAARPGCARTRCRGHRLAHAARLDRALFHKLATCDWIRDSQHLVIVGPTGIGKSWLACALGHKACREGFSVLYRRAPRLFADLATARGEGRLPRMLTTLERTRLLIIDDWGPEPLTAEQRRDLLEIVDDRYEKGSLLITSQVPSAAGTRSSAIPLSATRSSTASFIAPIGSS
jgi:hypothetical protein